ncbi:MAG TPA: hypothetical protein ENJ38_01210, partial [Rhodospirillales bacterium]|nr:hypothetical protein [Rhodospirillales bacterium]
MARYRSRFPWKGARYRLGVPVAVLGLTFLALGGSERVGDRLFLSAAQASPAGERSALRLREVLLRMRRELVAGAGDGAEGAAALPATPPGLPLPPPAAISPLASTGAASGGDLFLPARLEAPGLEGLPPIRPTAVAEVGTARPRARPREAGDRLPEPAAGPTPRRDPLDLPLREEERWRELLLTV